MHSLLYGGRIGRHCAPRWSIEGGFPAQPSTTIASSLHLPHDLAQLPSIPTASENFIPLTRQPARPRESRELFLFQLCKRIQERLDARNFVPGFPHETLRQAYRQRTQLCNRDRSRDWCLRSRIQGDRRLLVHHCAASRSRYGLLMVYFQTEASLSEPAAQEDDIFRSIAKAVARVNQFVSPSAACMLKAVADSSLPDNDRLHRLTST